MFPGLVPPDGRLTFRFSSVDTGLQATNAGVIEPGNRLGILQTSARKAFLFYDDGGAGNDIFDVGAGDDATDTMVLEDGDGDDTISGFEGPIDNGDGTFTGQDQIDTSGLTDADGNPVLVSDVTVADDGDGNAVLNFPNGESITLVGVAPSDVTDHDALAAMGIPQSDYIVEGTAGNDVIEAAMPVTRMAISSTI